MEKFSIFEKEDEKLSDNQEKLMTILESMKFDTSAMFLIMVSLENDNEKINQVLNTINNNTHITKEEIMDLVSDLSQPQEEN